MKLASDLHSVPRLRNCGTVTSLPLMPLGHTASEIVFAFLVMFKDVIIMCPFFLYKSERESSGE